VAGEMVLGQSKRIGDPCPNPRCALPLRRRDKSFYWQGEYKDGAFCLPCNTLYAIDGEEIEPLRVASQPVNQREGSR
jgi:hypothetical protein